MRKVHNGRVISAVAVGIMLVAAHSASAQTSPTPPADTIEPIVGVTMLILDLNRDGVIERGEIASEQDRMFAAADINGDGALSVDEFRRNGRLLLALNVTTFFDMLDSNGDGTLDAAEVKQPAGRWVARYDADGNGSLSIDEVRAARMGISN